MYLATNARKFIIHWGRFINIFNGHSPIYKVRTQDFCLWEKKLMPKGPWCEKVGKQCDISSHCVIIGTKFWDLVVT